MAGLRRFVTPEMLEYFSTGLSGTTSQDIANHVEDVVLLRAEVRESWTEEVTQYATVMLHWSARDYTVSLTKQRGRLRLSHRGQRGEADRIERGLDLHAIPAWQVVALGDPAGRIALRPAPSVTEVDDSSNGGINDRCCPRFFTLSRATATNPQDLIPNFFCFLPCSAATTLY